MRYSNYSCARDDRGGQYAINWDQDAGQVHISAVSAGTSSSVQLTPAEIDKLVMVWRLWRAKPGMGTSSSAVGIHT